LPLKHLHVRAGRFSQALHVPTPQMNDYYIMNDDSGQANDEGTLYCFDIISDFYVCVKVVGQRMEGLFLSLR
jgi:hypothetical protein